MLIVEDGTVVAGAESYCTVSYADTRHNNFGNTAWNSLSTANKEIALRKATAYMMQAYYRQWKGVRKETKQVLDWPRYFVYREDFAFSLIGLVSDTIVPLEVQDACAELALISTTEALNPDMTQNVKKEIVGPIQVEYDMYSSQIKRRPAITQMMSQYLNIYSPSVSMVK